MECTSHCITYFHIKKDDELPGALALGLSKVKTFFEDDSHGIPEEAFLVAHDGATNA